MLGQKAKLLNELEKLNGETVTISKERLIRIAAESKELSDAIRLLCPELRIPEVEKKQSESGLIKFFKENQHRIDHLFNDFFGYRFQVRSDGKYGFKGFYVVNPVDWEIVTELGGGGVIHYKGARE